MSIISVVVVLIVIGVLLWAIGSFIPMDARMLMIIRGVVLIAVIIWLLQVFGLLGTIGTARIR
jgi:hypothetical protein